MIDYIKIKQVIELLPNNQDILICGHNNTDYDSIGACYALTLFLNKIGKKAYMLLEKIDYDKLKWYGKYDYIISNYDIKYNYNFIMLDANRKSRLGIFEKYFDMATITINIDHHESNKKESNYIFVNEDISSTCEIIFNIINLFDNSFDKDIATLIYAGIASDTNSFYKRVTSSTMQVLSKLLEYNIDNVNIVKNTCKSLKMEETMVLSNMLSNINYDVFHYIIMDRKNSIYKDIDYNVIFKKCASTIFDIEEIEVVGLFLKELDGSISGIFRSNSFINVDELAIKLGGGGHKKASGFENNMNIEEIIKVSKDYIKMCYNNKRGVL